jgi:hypothetical protein
VAYVVVLGSVLAASRGIPFALDNFETFSTLIHARNMRLFGVRGTWGLADESYGLAAAQHPYVYTHGGNFPRLYSLLLQLLGARSAEAQIVLTTFTVGLLGFVFAYRFFSRLLSPSFAVVYCLLLLTDYLMQTQWLSNLWRVWAHFFVFSSLLCVEGLLRSRRLRRWQVAVTILNFACLAYLELVFAAFVTLLAGLYAGFTGYRRPRRLLLVWLVIGGGVALGAGVLVAQLVGFLGWQGFLQDTRLTFLSRNFAPGERRAFRKEVWSFVESHHVVFWDNMPEGPGNYRTFPILVQMLFRFCLDQYTPVLVYVALLVSAGWALTLLPSYDLVRVSREGLPRGRAGIWGLLLVLLVGVGLFVWAIVADRSFAGLPGRDGTGWEAPALFALVVAAFGLWSYRGRFFGGDGLPASRIAAGAVFLVAFAALARIHPWLYEAPGHPGSQLATQLGGLLDALGGAFVWRLVVFGAATIAVGLVLSGRALGTGPKGLSRLLRFVAAGLLAWSAVFCLSPGYLLIGYLTRYHPLLVYVVLVPFATAFYVLGVLGLDALRRRPGTTKLAEERPGTPPALAAASLLLLALLSTYWVVVQGHFVARLVGAGGLLKELEKPQYQGASFMVDSYAAPVAYQAGGWAYFDPVGGLSEVARIGDKFYLNRDFRYLWFADKDTNPEYFEPDYFVCWHRWTVTSRSSCHAVNIVSDARSGTGLLGFREVARDPIRDTWSIVKLDWTYPPGSSRKVQWDESQYERARALPVRTVGQKLDEPPPQPERGR